VSGAVATRRFRLVRNSPMERWILGHPDEFAPRFDVEEVDGWHMPVAVLATGVGAEYARAAITRAGGVEIVR
jgi:hypothetical protein